MKRKPVPSRPVRTRAAGPEVLAQPRRVLAETPGFQRQLEREFPAGPIPWPAGRPPAVSADHGRLVRLGGVAVAGCRRPEIEHPCLSASRSKATFRACPSTTRPRCRCAGSPFRSSAETHQGRPTKQLGGKSRLCPARPARPRLAAQGLLTSTFTTRTGRWRIPRTERSRRGGRVNDLLDSALAPPRRPNQGAWPRLSRRPNPPRHARAAVRRCGEVPSAVWPSTSAGWPTRAPAAASPAVFGAAPCGSILSICVGKRIRFPRPRLFLRGRWPGSLYYARGVSQRAAG